MKTVQVYNETKKQVLLERAGVADSFFHRLRGLMGKKSMPPGEGLIIKPCNALHTFGMRFPIDVAFVDTDNRICHIIAGMIPYRIGKIVKEADYVIEGETGLLLASGTEVGDRVVLNDI